MWVVRGLVQLLLRIVITTLVALAIAIVLSLVGAGSFDTDARILCIALGCMLLAMAGVGSGSNVERFMDVGVQQAAWGNVPGFDAIRAKPGDPTIAPGAAFFASGLVLIVLGLALF